MAMAMAVASVKYRPGPAPVGVLAEVISRSNFTFSGVAVEKMKGEKGASNAKKVGIGGAKNVRRIARRGRPRAAVVRMQAWPAAGAPLK